MDCCYTKTLGTYLLWYLNEKGSIVDALVTVSSYEVCIILLLHEFKIKIHSKFILYRIYNFSSIFFLLSTLKTPLFVLPKKKKKEKEKKRKGYTSVQM